MAVHVEDFVVRGVTLHGAAVDGELDLLGELLDVCVDPDELRRAARQGDDAAACHDEAAIRDVVAVVARNASNVVAERARRLYHCDGTDGPDGGWVREGMPMALLDLSDDALARVASILSLRDLSALASTCRQARDASRGWFGARHGGVRGLHPRANRERSSLRCLDVHENARRVADADESVRRIFDARRRRRVDDNDDPTTMTLEARRRRGAPPGHALLVLDEPVHERSAYWEVEILGNADDTGRRTRPSGPPGLEIGLAPGHAFRGGGVRGAEPTLDRDAAWFFDCFGIFTAGPKREQHLYGRKMGVGDVVGVSARVTADGVLRLAFYDCGGRERPGGCACMGVAVEGRLGGVGRKGGGDRKFDDAVFAFVRFSSAAGADSGVAVRRASPPEPVLRGLSRVAPGGYSARPASDDGVVYVRAIDPSGDVLAVPGLDPRVATVGTLRAAVAASVGHGAGPNHIDVYVGAMTMCVDTGCVDSGRWRRTTTTPLRVFECALCGGGDEGEGQSKAVGDDITLETLGIRFDPTTRVQTAVIMYNCRHLIS